MRFSFKDSLPLSNPTASWIGKPNHNCATLSIPSMTPLFLVLCAWPLHDVSGGGMLPHLAFFSPHFGSRWRLCCWSSCLGLWVVCASTKLVVSRAPPSGLWLLVGLMCKSEYLGEELPFVEATFSNSMSRSSPWLMVVN